MAQPSISILGPFDEATQEKLKRVDLACRAEAEAIRERVNKASLAGEDFQPSQQDLVSITIVECFGVLYNRAVEAGWIQDVQTIA